MVLVNRCKTAAQFFERGHNLTINAIAVLYRTTQLMQPVFKFLFQHRVKHASLFSTASPDLNAGNRSSKNRAASPGPGHTGAVSFKPHRDLPNQGFPSCPRPAPLLLTWGVVSFATMDGSLAACLGKEAVWLDQLPGIVRMANRRGWRSILPSMAFLLV